MTHPRHPGHNGNTCRACARRRENRHRHGDPIGISPPGTPRLPWAPIAVRLNGIAGATLTTADHARMLDRDHAQVYRWRDGPGLNVHQADAVATHIGDHPAELWGPAWWDIGFHLCPTVNAAELDEETAA